MAVDKEILDALKQFEWQVIINKSNKLEDLNERQWRFLKGLIIELIIEKHSGKEGLVYAGADHKDYDWPKYDLTVELKSLLSSSMYGKKGELNKNFHIKFNNSNGTNTKEKLDASDTADLLIVVKNDGAFVVDRQTVIDHAKSNGDGFALTLSKNDITEITGKMTVTDDTPLNMKHRILDAIRQAI